MYNNPRSDQSSVYRNLGQSRVGKLFIELAELSFMSKGLVDDLVDAVKVFGAEIEENLSEENKLVFGFN